LHQCFAREYPGGTIGRDRFLDVLRDAGLLLRRKRAPKSPTASAAERTGRQDLAHKLCVAGPGHLWVQDDTEVVTLGGKAHLALSTDAYSRKVVGYSWSRRANSEHVQVALKMALAGHVHGEMTLIHHSDNGSIYGSKAYQVLLEKESMAVSWSPPGRPDRNQLLNESIQPLSRNICVIRMRKALNRSNRICRYTSVITMNPGPT
jgi:putative transposase